MIRKTKLRIDAFVDIPPNESKKCPNNLSPEIAKMCYFFVEIYKIIAQNECTITSKTKKKDEDAKFKKILLFLKYFV